MILNEMKMSVRSFTDHAVMAENVSAHGQDILFVITLKRSVMMDQIWNAKAVAPV